MLLLVLPRQSIDDGLEQVADGQRHLLVLHGHEAADSVYPDGMENRCGLEAPPHPTPARTTVSCLHFPSLPAAGQVRGWVIATQAVGTFAQAADASWGPWPGKALDTSQAPFQRCRAALSNIVATRAGEVTEHVQGGKST